MAGTKEKIATSERVSQWKRVALQKKLLLLKIDDLYSEFKASYTLKSEKPFCGRSMFFFLRPENVIIPGGKGTHSVCVCTYHNNPKLMLTAIKSWVTDVEFWSNF